MMDLELSMLETSLHALPRNLQVTRGKDPDQPNKLCYSCHLPRVPWAPGKGRPPYQVVLKSSGQDARPWALLTFHCPWEPTILGFRYPLHDNNPQTWILAGPPLCTLDCHPPTWASNAISNILCPLTPTSYPQGLVLGINPRVSLVSSPPSPPAHPAAARPTALLPRHSLPQIGPTKSQVCHPLSRQWQKPWYDFSFCLSCPHKSRASFWNVNQIIFPPLIADDHT